jgi:hypothetical protein
MIHVKPKNPNTLTILEYLFGGSRTAYDIQETLGPIQDLPRILRMLEGRKLIIKRPFYVKKKTASNTEFLMFAGRRKNLYKINLNKTDLELTLKFYPELRKYLCKNSIIKDVVKEEFAETELAKHPDFEKLLDISPGFVDNLYFSPLSPEETIKELWDVISITQLSNPCIACVFDSLVQIGYMRDIQYGTLTPELKEYWENKKKK